MHLISIRKLIKEQSARFIQAARELEVDETGKAFEAAFDKTVGKPQIKATS